jgi:DNA helicase HerA-like ATPase
LIGLSPYIASVGTDESSLVIGERVLTLDPRPQGQITIDVSAFSRHLCILGTTGSGKSTCAAVLALELGRLRIPTVILDRTGEFVEHLSSLNPRILTPGKNLVISPFDPKGGYAYKQIEEWISLLDHFSHVSHGMGLSPLQYRVLREVFDQYFHGTQRPLAIHELITKLEQYENETEPSMLRGWAESIEALISRLWPLAHGVIGKTVNTYSRDFDVGQLFEPQVTIIDLSLLPDDRAKNMLSQIVLKEVYEETRKKGRTGSIRLAVILDEAQHLAPNEKGYVGIPERCAMELRKYGFSLIICVSRPSLISENIMANCNTLICHMLNNQTDIEAAAGFFTGSNVRDSLRRLPVGVAMLQVNHPEPKDSARIRVGTTEQRSKIVAGMKEPATDVSSVVEKAVLAG